VVPPSDLAGAIARNALYEADYRANVTGNPVFTANLNALVAEPLFGQYVLGGLWLRPYDVSQGGYPDFGSGETLFASESEYGTVDGEVSIVTLMVP
jgi:hypothetical protein